jgi:hypothetical protein
MAVHRGKPLATHAWVTFLSRTPEQAAPMRVPASFM